ncbi:MAG: hypothetical protein N4A41_08925 [Crocinitomicaceae bacterium]|jgi:predicted transcriptional regulator|nr:hypothetical protein [Crocinitomicaceae bacterium]
MDSAELHKSKIELAKMILSIESEAIIEKIMNLLRSEEIDFWDELTDEQKADIELGIQQADQGLTIPLEDVLKKIS